MLHKEHPTRLVIIDNSAGPRAAGSLYSPHILAFLRVQPAKKAALPPVEGQSGQTGVTWGDS